MAIKKSRLYNYLWKSCDELRGGMDASQYKDYVLVLLFVKYISDKKQTLEEEGFEVPEGATFEDMVKLKGDSEIGDKMNKIISKIAEENDLKGDIDVADFNDDSKLGKGKAMVDKLTNLIEIFETPELDFSKNRAEGDDLLGDAYEYLMQKFATESGKSKGQFYTPSEVSTIMAKLIGTGDVTRQDKTLYDPTCGSGSLLLKAANETEKGISIYGQEMDNATTALAKMNMILHKYPHAEIWNDNTISNPHFKENDGSLKRFDFAVSNPPFSTKSWSNGIDPENDEFGRFNELGVPPAKNGDYAFLIHLIKSLKSTGKGAIILPHGVLFRGNAEAEIRKNIIERGYIKGIIGLPPNLFYGTGIPACIMVIDKENASSRKDIFMIDGSKGYYKDGNKNRLRYMDMHKIVDVFQNRREIPGYSRNIPYSEIRDEKNNYNLNIPRYIENLDREDTQDIEGHLHGGIPKQDIDDLTDYWKAFPTLRKELFKEVRTGHYSLTVDEVKDTITTNKEYKEFADKVKDIFEKWRKNNQDFFYKIDIDSNPKEIISKISEEFLSLFSEVKLVDKYDFYQLLMNYWYEFMQDDLYIISFSGWKAEISAVTNNKGKKVGWKCELIPKELVTDKYFLADSVAIDDLKGKQEEITQKMNALEEENSGEEDLFSDVRSDSGKITKGELKKRIKEINGDSELEDELKLLQAYLSLIEEEAKVKKEIQEKEKELDKKLYDKYQKLTPEEIKELVIEDKWMSKLHESVTEEIDNLSRNLASRLKELNERYYEPLPKIVKEVQDYESKVKDHLKDMGFEW